MSDYLPPLNRADGDQALAVLGDDAIGGLARVVLTRLWAAGGYQPNPLDDYTLSLDVLWRAEMTTYHRTYFDDDARGAIAQVLADPALLRSERVEAWIDVTTRLAPFVHVDDSSDALTALPRAAWDSGRWAA